MEQRLRDMLLEMGDLSLFEVRMLETVVIVLVLMAVRLVLISLIGGRMTDERSRYYWRKGVSYGIALLALFVIGRIWFEGFRSIATFLGLVSAGLVIALKEPLSNLAAWFFMLWRPPFVLGDRVQIGTVTGDVIDLRLFLFSVLEIGNWVDSDQSTGRIIHVPNGRVFMEPVANYTRSFPYLWNEVSVVITYESNWRAAKSALQAIADRHGRLLTPTAEAEVLEESRRYMIFYSTLAPTVYTSVNERGVVLTVRYLCEPRRRRDTEQSIWEDMLDMFAARDDIDLAYPTRRVFDRTREYTTLGGDAVADRSAQVVDPTGTDRDGQGRIDGRA